jgi:hypothetical protein
MVRKATSELDSGRFKSRLAYRIYDDSSEDGAGDCLAFSRAGVGDSSHQLFVAASVQYSKDAENYDGEDGDDGARSESSQLANSLGVLSRMDIPRPSVHGTDDGLHGDEEERRRPKNSTNYK